MTWPAFFLGCFVIGFLLSVLSVAFGVVDAHVHFPWETHVPTGTLHAGHAGAMGPINFATITAFVAWFGGGGYLLTTEFRWLALPALGASLIVGLCGAGVSPVQGAGGDVGLPREVDVRVDYSEDEGERAEQEPDDEAAEEDRRPVHDCSSGTSVSESRSTRPGIETISPSSTRHRRDSACMPMRSSAALSAGSWANRVAPSWSQRSSAVSTVATSDVSSVWYPGGSLTRYPGCTLKKRASSCRDSCDRWRRVPFSIRER